MVSDNTKQGTWVKRVFVVVATDEQGKPTEIREVTDTSSSQQVMEYEEYEEVTSSQPHNEASATFTITDPRSMQELIKALELELTQCKRYTTNSRGCEFWRIGVRTGWYYKPRINPAARKPHKQQAYWHRVRSFCVRKGYH
jgi:hypothetical protein